LASFGLALRVEPVSFDIREFESREPHFYFSSQRFHLFADGFLNQFFERLLDGSVSGSEPMELFPAFLGAKLAIFPRPGE
jgi:hypothetical protein